MATVRISVSLDAVRDAELLRWLAEQPSGNVSGIVREALVLYRKRDSTIEARLTSTEEKLDRLLALMRSSRIAVEEPQAEGSEPSKARDGLEAMKRRFQQ